MSQPSGVHLIVGGYPPGSPAAHDMDYVRLRLLNDLAGTDGHTTVSSDYADLDRWLPPASLLLTYVAGPIPSDDDHAHLRSWLESGGRWVALHGTSGGKAARVERDGRKGRMMVRQPHHETLGGFFLNHPPVQRFTVTVTGGHPLTEGLPTTFDAVDELYLIELRDREHTDVLLTTQLPADPSPPGFGFAYDADTSALDDTGTRALGYVHQVGDGAVAYVALGHTHSPATNSQPFVDRSVTADGVTPLTFRGVWENDVFGQLLANAIAWGTADR